MSLGVILDEIAEVIGKGPALELAQHLGGQYLYVPKCPKGHSEITNIIGLEAARKLGQHFGGLRIDLPRANAESIRRLHNRVINEVKAGRSKTEVAKRMGLTTRWVRKLCNRSDGRDDRQNELF